MTAEPRPAPSPPTHPSGSPFDRRLGDHLRRQAARYVAAVTTDQVDEARRRHRHLASARSAGIVGATMVVMALVVAAVSVLGEPAPASSTHLSHGGPSQPATEPSARAAPTSAQAAPIGLADCEIAPPDASLAYAGWATLDVLRVGGGQAARGSPVYAVVTRGMAEWIGWQASGGAMYPRPVGRMGCVYDPTTRQASVVGVPMDWQPPATRAGCPASPVTRFGSYREVGGPSGWLILSRNSAGRILGTDFHTRLRFRLSPPPHPGQSVSAWAFSLDGRSMVIGDVSLEGALRRPPAAIAAGTQASAFYDVRLRFSRAGCWVIDMAINGEVAGSAILAIDGGPATPRPPTTLP